MPKVIIAEDEPVIAEMAEVALVYYGYDVCGVARTVAQGVSLARHHKPDLAIINLYLAGGEAGIELAAELDDVHGLGILFVTGGNEYALTAANGHACLSKPYRDNDLRRALEIVAEIVGAGSGSPPFPPGFRVLHAAPNTTGRRVADKQSHALPKL